MGDMSEEAYRVEHDTMGRSGAARRVVAGPDPAGRRELPDLRHHARARAHPCPRPDQGGSGPRQRGARSPRRRHRPGHRASGARGRRREARRRVPDRRVPDRVGHVEQHERERGHRHPRHPRTRTRRPPQRPRQREPVEQRHVPDLDPRRRDRSGQPRPDPGAGSPCGRVRGQGVRVRRRGQVRPHTPDGRHPGDARPGVRWVRRPAPPRDRATRVVPPPTGRAPSRRHRGGHRHQHPARVRGEGDRRTRGAHGPAADGGARPLRGARQPRRPGRDERSAPHDRRRPAQDVHRPALDGVGATRRAR